MKADEVCSSYRNPAVMVQTRLGYNCAKRKWANSLVTMDLNSYFTFRGVFCWLVFSRLKHIRVVGVSIVIVANKMLVCMMWLYSLVAFCFVHCNSFFKTDPLLLAQKSKLYYF